MQRKNETHFWPRLAKIKMHVSTINDSNSRPISKLWSMCIRFKVQVCTLQRTENDLYSLP